MRAHIAISLLGLSVGCGGNVTGSNDAGPANDTGEPTDSGGLDAWGVNPDGGPWSPVCPVTLPLAGSSCSDNDMLMCEYGDAWWDVGCDTVVQCIRGVWASVSVGSSVTCFPLASNPSTCPVNPEVSQGASCPQDQELCFYEEGAFCECHQEGQQDGGPVWRCGPTDSGCPSSRPRIGAGCSSSPICTYAGCLNLVCMNGTWQYEVISC